MDCSGDHEEASLITPEGHQEKETLATADDLTVIESRQACESYEKETQWNANDIKGIDPSEQAWKSKEKQTRWTVNDITATQFH